MRPTLRINLAAVGLPSKVSPSIMEPAQVRSTASPSPSNPTWRRRRESIADVVMKVVMLCSPRVFSPRMYFWRSCQSATGPHDRQFTLKENGGLQTTWQPPTRGGERGNLGVEHRSLRCTSRGKHAHHFPVRQDDGFICLPPPTLLASQTNGDVSAMKQTHKTSR